MQRAPARKPVLWVLGVLTAGLTSFYMFRLLFLTFFGAPRYDEHNVHVHESPKNMLVPLVVLAILSVCGGWMAAPQLCGRRESLRAFPGAGAVDWREACCCGSRNLREAAARFCRRFFGAPVIAGLLGFFLAWWLYIKSPETPKKTCGIAFAALYNFCCGKYFVDELYAAVIVRPLVWISDKVLVARGRRRRD